MIRRLVVLTLTLMAAYAPNPGASSGAEGMTTAASAITISVPTKTVFSETDPVPLASVRLRAGPTLPRSLYGRFVVTLPAGAPAGNLMAGGTISCVRASTGSLHSSVSTTQNLWVQGSQITMVARMLFAPAVEADFDCRLVAYVRKLDSDHYLTYLGGTGRTALIYSSPTWIKKWGAGNDSKHAGFTEWDALRRKSHDYPEATHIHAGITDAATDGTIIGNAEYVTKGGSFVVPAGPTHINAIAGIHMTSCFNGDKVCFEGARSQGGAASSTTSVVDLSIIVSQRYADGSVCIQDAGPVSRVTILGDSHHQTVNLALPGIPINPCDGSRRFSLKVLVTRVWGNPVRIERGDLIATDPTRFTGYTHLGVYY